MAQAALELLGGRAAILDEENEARNLRLFRQVQAAIGSRAHVEAIENVCVFQRIPRWMLPRAPSLRDVEEAGLLRDGLERIAKWWRGELARRGQRQGGVTEKGALAGSRAPENNGATDRT